MLEKLVRAIARVTARAKSEKAPPVLVQDLMTHEVHTCRRGDPCTVAARLLWEQDCGVVPVLDEDDRVAGVVTDRDLCLTAYFQGVRLEDIEVRAAMSREAHTVRPDQTAVEAARVLREHLVRRVPVVGPDGRIAGVLSLNDLILAASERRFPSAELVRTLAAVSTHRRPLVTV